MGASFGALCIRTVVSSTDAVSAVVWLGWGVGTCGVRLSRSVTLIFPVVWPCDTNPVLFCSILPLSSLGLPHIFLTGPR